MQPAAERNLLRILLVGAGKMGSALLTRWHQQKIVGDIPAGDILVVDTARNLKSPDDLPPGFFPDVVVFAVKPQTLPDILPLYRRFTEKGTLFLSIAAGRSIGFFRRHLGDDAVIIRAMPNTSAAIGAGITGLFAPAGTPDKYRDQAELLLSAVGDVVWVEEEPLLDAVTALSGSGPAYVFLLMECMAAAGEALGLPRETAEKLARQTVIGSGRLAQAEAQTPPARLRESVTSPNGTTAAALEVLMSPPQSMNNLMKDALAAAARRARELND